MGKTVFILGDPCHISKKIADIEEHYIKKISKGKEEKVILFTEVFRVTEKNLIEKLKYQDEEEIKKRCGIYSKMIKYCLTNNIQLFPIAPSNSYIQKNRDEEIFYNFKLQFDEINRQKKIEIYFVDIGADHIKPFEENFRKFYKDYILISILLDPRQQVDTNLHTLKFLLFQFF